MFRLLKFLFKTSWNYFLFISLLLMLMPLPSTVKAQVNIDSIENIIHKTRATERPFLYLKYAGELSGKNDKAAFEYAQKALAYYVKSGNKFLEAEARSAIAEILYNKDNFKQSIDWYQQAFKLYKIENNKEKMAMCLNNIGYNYSFLSDYKEAINFYNQSLKISLGKYSDEEGRSNYFYGLALRNLEKRDEALEKIKKSLDLFKKSDDIRNLSKAYYYLGLIYYEKSLYQQSIENYQIADSLKNKIGDIEGRAKTLNNIGNVLLALGKIRKCNCSLPGCNQDL